MGGRSRSYRALGGRSRSLLSSRSALLIHWDASSLGSALRRHYQVWESLWPPWDNQTDVPRDVARGQDLRFSRQTVRGAIARVGDPRRARGRAKRTTARSLARG